MATALIAGAFALGAAPASASVTDAPTISPAPLVSNPVPFTSDKTVVLSAATGQVVAVVDTSDPVSPQAVTPVGPGCSTTSLCVTGFPAYGYQGTGTLAVNLSGRTGYNPGNQKAQLKWVYGGSTVTGTQTAAYSTVAFDATVRVTSVKRG